MSKAQIWLIKERIKHCTKLLNYTPNEEVYKALKEEIEKMKVELADALLSADDEAFNQVIDLVAVN